MNRRLLLERAAGIEKSSSPRWAKELDRLVSSGDYARADEQAREYARRGIKPRQIGRRVAYGRDVSAVTMAGMVPGENAPTNGLFKAKFLHPYGGLDVQNDLRERELLERLVGDDHAKSYGRYVGSSGGGVELQEFLPGDVSARGREELAEKVHEDTSRARRFWPKRHLWDLNDHDGNIRATVDGQPKVLDGKFDGGRWVPLKNNSTKARMFKNRHEHHQQTMLAGVEALREAFEGKAETPGRIRMFPELADHAWRKIPLEAKLLGVGLALTGGLVALSKGLGWDEKARLREEARRERLKKVASHGLRKSR